MKNNKLYGIAGIVLGLVLLLGCLFPAGAATAETESEWITMESEVVVETEPEIHPEYERAAQILEDNLRATGTVMNADKKLYDFFGKFSTGEQEEISAWITEQEEKSNISIRVFVAEMAAADEKYFLEECADMLCDNEYAKEDLAIMLLNLDPVNRGVCIQGYGSCEYSLNDDRIEYILDDIIEWFLADDYVYGVKLFAKEAAYYATVAEETEVTTPGDTSRPVGTVPYVPYYKDNSFKGKLNRMPWPVLVIVPAGVAGVGIFLMIQNNGSKKTTTGKTYMDSESSGLTAKKDDYLRTGVSKTYSPVSSSSSGSRSSGGRSSGGGGRSSGGRSHSGGSRRF